MHFFYQSAESLLQRVRESSDELRITCHSESRTDVYDFGVKSPGGIEAGCRLAELCMANLGQVSIQADPTSGRPMVTVQTDHPIQACLMAQYAGWKIATDDYFAMASGPMRSIAQAEELFQEFSAPDADQQTTAIGVLESGKLPSASAIQKIQQALPNRKLALCVAPTASQAGNLQVVARSVETAMHKLHEIGFPVTKVISGFGCCPLPSVASDDLEGIGRTNDAILYGATVNLWVDCSDSTIQEFGPQTPSNSSSAHGQKFIDLFQAAGYDFYQLDKHLFSPARICFHSLTSGHRYEFGELVPELIP